MCFWHNISNITLAPEKELVHPITAIPMPISNSISNSCMPLRQIVCVVAAVKGIIFKTSVKFWTPCGGVEKMDSLNMWDTALSLRAHNTILLHWVQSLIEKKEGPVRNISASRGNKSCVRVKGTGHDFCRSGKPIYHLQKQGNIYISKQITKSRHICWNNEEKHGFW